MKFCFISDTHNKHNQLAIPECDILFHSGDWTSKGMKHEVEAFAKWLEKQPAKNIIIIPGNHECDFEKNLPESRNWVLNRCPRAKVLIHESIEVEGLKIFGSPYTPAFGRGWAWNAGRTIVESAHIFKPYIGDLWKDIPEETEILLTHGPGLGTLDWVSDWNSGRIENVGCRELMEKIKTLPNLKIHSFGHLHLKGGCKITEDNVVYINAAICDDQYKAFDYRKVILTL